MHLIFFYASFLIDLALGKEVRAKKYHCNVKIEEIDFENTIVPAAINTNNFSQLICALRCFGVERAEVAGWHDHKGFYVLYSNGTVVPGQESDAPEYALYIRTSKYCKTEIVLVRKCCDGNRCYKIICKTIPAGEAVCDLSTQPYTEYACQPSYETSLPQYIPENPSCNPSEMCYDDVFCNNIVDEYKPCEVGQQCVAFSGVCKKISRDKCSVTKEILEKSTKFVFKEICGDFQVTVYQDKIDKKKIVMKQPLDQIKIVPKILNNPKHLLRILRKANARFRDEVCLYIDAKSNVYVISRNALYVVKCKSKKIKFMCLSSKYSKKIIKKGIYLVEFI